MSGDLTRYQDLILFDGSTFFISELNGDAQPETSEGYFHDDVRHLSVWCLRVDGEPLQGITARAVDYDTARVHAVASPEAPRYSVRRDRFVADGVHEDLVVTSHVAEEQELTLELRFGSDFADVMEAQQGGAGDRGRVEAKVEQDERSVTLSYELDGFRCGTTIRFSERCTVHEDRAVFELRLPPHGEWKTCVDVTASAGRGDAEPLLRCDSFGESGPELPISLPEWFERAPRLECDDAALRATYHQSLLDLASLRIRPDEELQHAMPAGGIPWFMTVFGRDSIVAAYEALPFAPSLAEGTLRELARLQADEWDDWRDAEPGKIAHELRRGKLAELGEIPHTPYYGTHDATLLWLILLDEYERWTGDRDLVRELEPNARLALDWLGRYADLDGDGFLDYQSRSDGGLTNLCWKDSDDGILFADGSVAKPPIATCENQGYAYDARLRAARLARELWDDEPLAAGLEADALALKDRFNDTFWNEERRTFLLALAGTVKARVDSVTSNPGQCLWSGIVDEDKAGPVVERLLRDDLFSGWGVRSLSSEDAGYSPLRYHDGTVWPHDTALIAEGMRRYGFRDEATRLACAVLDAAEAFSHQLPELFAGFARDDANAPVRYPGALTPQSWAAGAPLLALRTLLGLEPDAGELRCEPHLPERYEGLRLEGVPFRVSSAA
jgi:glycogen debranching enzyme